MLRGLAPGYFDYGTHGEVDAQSYEEPFVKKHHGAEGRIQYVPEQCLV